MKFNNKQEYLTWRSEWRANYRALSKQIRDIKFARWYADSVRGGVKMSEAQEERFKAIHKANATQWGFCPSSFLQNLKVKATAMLKERKASKIACQECYVREHQPAIQAVPSIA